MKVGRFRHREQKKQSGPCFVSFRFFVCGTPVVVGLSDQGWCRLLSCCHWLIKGPIGTRRARYCTAEVRDRVVVFVSLTTSNSSKSSTTLFVYSNEAQDGTSDGRTRFHGLVDHGHVSVVVNVVLLLPDTKCLGGCAERLKQLWVVWTFVALCVAIC